MQKFEAGSYCWGWVNATARNCVAAGLMLALCQPSLAQSERDIPLFMSASNEVQEGFVRVINRSADSGTVTIRAVDDSGQEFSPSTLTIGGSATVNFNSGDLETGNASKGLSPGVGRGEGDWRLVLQSSQDIQPMAYIRTADGFVTGMQDLVRETISDGNHAGYHVPIFNPGSNRAQRSSLRLINTSNNQVEVRIEGIDDKGTAAPGGDVRVELRAGESLSVMAQDLEDGAPRLAGALGDGQGKWRLLLTAEREVRALSLLESPTGHLANISRGGSTRPLDLDDPPVEPVHSIPLFLSVSNGGREGFARIVNHSENAGDVSIRAVDDSGRTFGPVELALDGKAAANFNSGDLERGNPAKGLPMGVGDGQGEWQLELTSDLPIEALAFIRTADGFVTNVQDIVFDDGDVPIFNPASNTNQRSSLRLINTLDRPVEIMIEGIDDQGTLGDGELIRLTLAANEARTLTAEELEMGGEGIRGRLGDGVGKWRLSVSAPQGVVVMSLLESPTGHLANVSGGAFAEPLRLSDADGDGASDFEDAFPKDSSRQAPVNGMSTTLNDQVIFELGPADAEAPNLFDLRGKTLLFQRDIEDGYVREVRPLEWESDIGNVVGDEAVALEQFAFPFAGSDWNSVYVSHEGGITFGEPLGLPIPEQRFAEMRDLGGSFTKGQPTIAALYKPQSVGQRFVNHLPDRLVVTWKTQEPHDGWQGFSLAPALNEFQAVLHADGNVAFNYLEVAVDDGIVGMFPPFTKPIRGARIVTLPESTDADLPGHLDLTEVTVFETDTESLIVEFATRGAIPEEGDDNVNGLNFTLYLDIDDPLTTRIDFGDADYRWGIVGDTNHRYVVVGAGAQSVYPPDDASPDRIRLVLDSIPEFEGGSVAVFADAYEAVDGNLGRFDQAGPVEVELSPVGTRPLDLSVAGTHKSTGYESFHYRGLPDRFDLTCRLIRSLGDGFDFVFFHAQFRSDQQEAGSPMNLVGEVAEGLGSRGRWPSDLYCSEGQLKGLTIYPMYMSSNQGRGASRLGPSRDFDYALFQLGHEMTHVWNVYASYDRQGERIPVYQVQGDGCACHWRQDLHVPVAFPWHENKRGSDMGGRYWEDNEDGTFTQRFELAAADGFAHLDLYFMGLLDAAEVPETFLVRDSTFLRNAFGVGRVYSGEKEVVSIEQIVAAIGPRHPAASNSQQNFNVGFVYLVEPGRSPKSLSLQRHAALRDQFVEWWVHVTGNRSEITTNVEFASDVGFGREPEEIGRGLLPDVGIPPISGVRSGVCDHPVSMHDTPRRSAAPG